LSDTYKNDDNARSICRQLMALALLPLNEMEFAVEELAEEHPTALEPLFDYFNNFWMQQTPTHLWNASDLKTCTSNNCEGNISFFLLQLNSFVTIIEWHHRFNRRVDKKHPNIWHLLDVLRKEEVHFQQQVLHAKSGLLKKKSKKNCIAQQQLKVLASRFEDNEIDLNEYLEALSIFVAKNVKASK
jgi:hypothetical protein